MAFDEKLAGRVRRALARYQAVAEIRMFGGLCFTIRGLERSQARLRFVLTRRRVPDPFNLLRLLRVELRGGLSFESSRA